MSFEMRSSRRALLKAGVALGGVALVACGESKPAPTAATTPAAPEAPVVATKFGKIKGFVEDGVLGFKGVRYGADTAKARFQPPADPEPWTDVAEATKYANSAPQNPTTDGGGLYKSWRPEPGPPKGEDCLFLNVWTPAADDKKRTVMVWFHGGGFATGSGSSLAYDGVRLAKRGDVVVVTVNHRLNVFGYLNLAKYGPEFADSGAVGILDMVHALKWVRDNISAFGGDPGNVMIFGQSGGGMKVCTLLAMESAKGLFHRAVVQSGPRIRHASVKASGKGADAFVKELGLTKETIAEIKTKPVADLLKAFEKVPAAGAGPVRDGRSLKVDPFDPKASDISAEVPVMIGVCRTEGTSLEGGTKPELFDLTWETLPAALKKSLPKSDPTKVISQYKKTKPDIEAPEVYFGATSDSFFFVNSVTVADRRSALPGKVWFYEVDWTSPVKGGKRYVPHAVDNAMVFDNVAKSESMSGTGPDAQHIADMMSETWLAFAKTGDPSNKTIPEWPAYTPDKRPMMVFRDKPGVENDIRAAERKLVAVA